MSLFRRKTKVPALDVAEAGPLWANIAAGAIQAAYGHTVTYGVEDLVYVNQALSDLAAGEDLGNKARTIQAFGFLVGEILIRNDGGKWVALDAEMAALCDFSIGVEMPSGHLVNPIGAAFKRVSGGEERSLLRFRAGVLGVIESEDV